MACLYPFYVNDVPVPCGKCPKCLVRRADSWIFRIMQEERYSISSHFLTLTYGDGMCPISHNGYKTLCKRDLQMFFKRLRSYMWERSQVRKRTGVPSYPYTLPVKYYACGEYGATRQRPHYHVIILNADPYYFERAWSDEDGVIRGDVYFEDKGISSSAIGYTCGYMNKPKVVPLHHRDDRLKEFSVMSKKFGLQYLTPQMIAYHKADLNRNFVTLPGGKRSALPRYYSDRIYSKADKEAMQPLLDTSIRRQYKKVYDEHVRLYGNADDFIRSQAEARRAAVKNFQVKSKIRKDL